MTLSKSALVVLVVVACALVTSVRAGGDCGADDRLCGGASCGDGVCGNGESCRSCPFDCGACPECEDTCGNGLCEAGENSCNCFRDCTGCCADGICNTAAGETYENCAADCHFSATIVVGDCDFHDERIAGATVHCRNTLGDEFEGTTDERGEFSFEATAPGAYRCQAEAAGRILESDAFTFDQSRTTFQQARLFLGLCEVTGILGGVVTTDAGALVQNVAVVCSTSGVGQVSTNLKQTSEDGFFLFTGVKPSPNGTEYTCRASKATFVTASASTSVTSGGIASVSLVLLAIPGSLRGSVIDVRAGALVLEPTNITCVNVETDRPLIPQTITDGEFEFDPVQVGTYQCTATTDGWSSNSTMVVVPEGAEGTGTIFIEELPGTITGAVFQQSADPSRNDTVVSGVTVRCESVFTDPAVLEFAVSADDGTFTITDLIDGDYTCNGQDPLRYDPSETQLVTVLRGGVSQLTITMIAKPGTVQGRVNTPASFGSRAISGATVTCIDSNATTHTAISSSILEVEPVNWDVTNVAPGLVGCTCELTGFVSPNVTSTGVLESNSILNLNCVLEPRLNNITITLIDAETLVPLDAATVVCVGVTVEYVAQRPPAGQGPGPYHFSGTTELLAGTYECFATATGYQDLPRQEQIVLEGDEEAVREYAMQRLPAALRGTVIDTSAPGSNFPGVSVSCDFAPDFGDDETRSTTADITGRYVFSPVAAPGTVNCTADAATHFPQTRGPVTLVPGVETRLDFELFPIEADLSITIVDQQLGFPIVGSVTCTGLAPLNYRQSVPSVGITTEPQAHVFSNLRVGEYECVAVSGSDYFPSAAPIVISVTTGDALERSIPLEPRAGDINGFVRDGGANPPIAIAGASVVCSFPDQTPVLDLPEQSTTASGAYLYESIAVFGRVRCCAEAAGFREQVCGEAIKPRGAPVTINIALLPLAAEARGSASDANGPLEGVAIRFTHSSASGSQFFTDANGNFGPGEIPRGLITDVTCSLDGYQNAKPRTCSLPCDPTTGAFRIEEGELQVIDCFMVPEPGTLRVIVEACETGSRLGGVSVTCWNVNTPGTILTPTITPTQAGVGEAEFAGIEGDANYECRLAGLSGYEERTTGPYLVARGDEVFQFESLALKNIPLFGTITSTADQAPIKGALVTLVNFNTNAELPDSPVVTDDAGEYHFTTVTPMVLRISVSHPLYNDRNNQRSPSTNQPDITESSASFLLEDGAFDFALAPAPATIAGVVRRENDQPVPNAVTALWERLADGTEAPLGSGRPAGSDGAYVWTPPVGDAGETRHLFVVASAAGQGLSSQRFDAGVMRSGTVFASPAGDIFMSRTTDGTITGVVTDRSTGLPLEGVSVTAQGFDNTVIERTSTHLGEFVVSNLRPRTDPQQVCFARQGFVPQCDTVALIEAGESYTLDVSLQANYGQIAVTFRTVDADGVPVNDNLIELKSIRIGVGLPGGLAGEEIQLGDEAVGTIPFVPIGNGYTVVCATPLKRFVDDQVSSLETDVTASQNGAATCVFTVAPAAARDCVDKK